MNPLLSIIIPMYNAERYIVRCIESLRELKILKEVIVVDDGSSDGSYDIARKFASNGEIKLFHQENKGVSEARNLGLDRCSGDVVVFVDSDDFIIGEGFQSMYNNFTLSKAEMAITVKWLEGYGKEMNVSQILCTQTHSHHWCFAICSRSRFLIE